MNNPLLILLLSRGVYGKAWFIPLLKAEVSKVDQGLCIESLEFQRPRGQYFFYTCLNLGQLFPHNFKNLHGHSPRNLNPKIYNLP
jgi:hypothetical protein